LPVSLDDAPIISDFWQGEAPAEPFPEEKAPQERRPTGLTILVNETLYSLMIGDAAKKTLFPRGLFVFSGAA
jgi:hypothetical protein